MQFARLVGPRGTVCAFEPNPFNADRLKLNLSENPELGDCIRIFPLALANSHGKTKFKVHRNIDAGISSASHLEGAHTTLSEEQLSHLGFTEVDVDVVTLDDFFAPNRFLAALPEDRYRGRGTSGAGGWDQRAQAFIAPFCSSSCTRFTAL
jgi:FkbM family methyltransferase